MSVTNSSSHGKQNERKVDQHDVDMENMSRRTSSRTKFFFCAAVLSAAGAIATVCLIVFAQMNSIVCFLSALFLLFASIVLLFATCASTLWERRRPVVGTSCAILSLALLLFMIATAVQLCRRGSNAPEARFVGDIEPVFGNNVDTGDNRFSEFRIPSLVATKTTLVAFAEGRRGTTGLHGDFAPTELVFRARPMAGEGEVPEKWTPLESLASLLRNSSYCSVNKSECLPEDCQRHMSNPAPAVTSPERGELLMVFNCENQGTYAVHLNVGQVAGAPLVSVAGPVQTVLKSPPQDAKWVGVGPPASLFIAAEGAVIVPLYYAWTRKPELFDGLDSFGMTLRYDLASKNWSVPCQQYGESKGQVNEHQYFTYGGEVWALARTVNYNPWTPRRTLLHRGVAGSGETCFEVVAEPRFLEQLQGCEGSVITLGENESERIFYTGVDGSVLYRRKLQLFEAQTGGHTEQPTIKEWNPLATIHNFGAAYSSLAWADAGLLGILYERSQKAMLSFHPDDIVFQRVDVSTMTARRLAPSGLRGSHSVAASRQSN